MKEGDIVYIEYDAWLVSEDENKLFETTSRERAEEHDIFDENHQYRAIPVMLGRGSIFSGLEKAVMESEVDAEGEVEIPPEEGAGARDPNLVKRFTLTEFKKNDIDPVEGMTVTLKGRTGTVMMVSPGRVVVDFNNPLAGKTVKYTFKIVSHAQDDESKAKAILDMHYGDPDEFGYEFDDDGGLAIRLADRCRYDTRWFEVKFRVVADLRKALGDIDITFQELYVGKHEEEESEEADGDDAEDGAEPDAGESVEEELPAEETEEDAAPPPPQD